MMLSRTEKGKEIEVQCFADFNKPARFHCLPFQYAVYVLLRYTYFAPKLRFAQSKLVASFVDSLTYMHVFYVIIHAIPSINTS